MDTLDDHDVVVVGSGAAGLTSALSAADAGARVLVLERSDLVGGTSAISGGQIWSPGNRFMAQGGRPDDREAALTYLDHVTLGNVSRGRLASYLAASPSLLPFLEERTALRFFSLDRVDYHPTVEGARSGRSFEPEPYDASRLGAWRDRVRVSPIRAPATSRELRAGVEETVLVRRRAASIRTQGAALVAGLVQACLDRGVTIMTGCRVRDLVRGGDGVAGCRVITAEGERPVSAGAVILASGGFEWNTALKRAFLAPADEAPTSPPWNEGDGLVMALGLGAGVANMTEAWWTAAVRVPGEEWDGKPLFRNIVRELALPGSILVNRAGARFVNEASSYHDLGKAFQRFDPGAYAYPNRSAWLIVDERSRRRYPIVTVKPTDATPAWIASADDIASLAEMIGVDAPGLSRTIEAFNRDAERGEDPLFARGSDAHGQGYGDPAHGPNPCLAPLAEPPFYALPILLGNNGTKGGLVTDAVGRVLRFDEQPIAGLFACGDVSASLMGPGYAGTGASLGPAMTMAILAGRAASAKRES